jgi:hypothetical protein
MAVEGYSSTVEFKPVTHEGTIKWTVINDAGEHCNLIIPKSLYVPSNNHRLLSPQHLAQVLKEKEKCVNGTKCTTYASTMVLEWDDLKHKVTVPIDRRTANIGRMYTAPGFKKYMAYAARTRELFDETMDDAIECNRMEVVNKEETIMEEGDIVYEQSDRQEDGLIQANVGFKKVELMSHQAPPDVERLEATTMSPEDELFR